jgi:hypothetical protein
MLRELATSAASVNLLSVGASQASGVSQTVTVQVLLRGPCAHAGQEHDHECGVAFHILVHTALGRIAILWRGDEAERRSVRLFARRSPM